MHVTLQDTQALLAANHRLLTMQAAQKAVEEQQALVAVRQAMTLHPVGQWQATPVELVVPAERVRRCC